MINVNVTDAALELDKKITKKAKVGVAEAKIEK